VLAKLICLAGIESAAHLLREGVRWMALGVRLRLVRRSILELGLLSLLTHQASAGSVQSIGLYDGGNAPIVEIQYSGSSGAWVYGDAQTATNWTNSNRSSIPLYCIDLQHDDYLGSTYQLTEWTDPNSFSSDAINRVAWAVHNASLAEYGPAAAQLLIWSVIDPNFSVINWNGNTGAGSLEAAYDALESRMIASYNSVEVIRLSARSPGAHGEPARSATSDGLNR
jgi:hypothetical protein